MSRSDLSIAESLLQDGGHRPRAIAIADPAEPGASLNPGDLVLGVGVSGTVAVELIQLAAAAAATGVVLRRPPGAAANHLAKQAQSSGIALHWLSDEMSWTDLHRQLVEALSPVPIAVDDELADLAQTIATLTGGLVTIEDTAARVLAYSRSSDEVDDLRRLSILGRSGPAPYLALLREWGIYDRLASSEEVVEIDEHPESGVRRRLAVGVFAGDRQLGTIWVQQGQDDFPPHAKQALLGAARVTASQLVAQRSQTPSRSVATDVGALLDGRSTSVPIEFGRAARKPCAVAVFDVGERSSNRAADRLELDELAGIVTVQAAAYRRDAVVSQLDGRIYLLLPSLEGTASATAVLTEAVAAARRHLHPHTRGALGPLVDSMAGAARSRRGADRALNLGLADRLVTFEAARPALLTRIVSEAVNNDTDLHDPRLTALAADEPELARTLLHYLDTGSDAARVATDLRVHVTTVRYRLRRALEQADLDLTDPDIRLATQLQLRAAGVLHPTR
jgi:DNA-binding PucR family transcriptional regulator